MLTISDPKPLTAVIDPSTPLVDIRYLAWDIETTGLSPTEDRIIEIGATVFRLQGDGLIVDDRFSMLGNPGWPIHPGAGAVHGITDDQVANQWPIDAHCGLMVHFGGFLRQHAGRAVAIAHNGHGFDGRFVAEQASRQGLDLPHIPMVDTLIVARRINPRGGNALDAWLSRYGLGPRGQHRAADDAYRLALVWRGMLREFGNLVTWADLEAIPGCVVA